MRKQKRKRGYYRSVRFGVDRKELSGMFGEKRATKYVKFLKDICFKLNYRYDVIEVANNTVVLRMWQMDFYNDIDNRYEDMFMYDLVLRKYNTQIADGFEINLTFIGFEDSDIDDLKRAILTEDIYNIEKEYNILEDQNFFVQESLKKSEIIGTLGEFRNNFIPEKYNCYIKMGADPELAEVINNEFEDTIVTMYVEDLSVVVGENGLVMYPVPIKNEVDFTHISITCKPYEMSSEELIQTLAQLFTLAAA